MIGWSKGQVAVEYVVICGRGSVCVDGSVAWTRERCVDEGGRGIVLRGWCWEKGEVK